MEMIFESKSKSEFETKEPKELYDNDIRLLTSALDKAQFIYRLIMQSDAVFNNDENFFAVLRCLKLMGEICNPEAEYHIPIKKELITNLCRTFPYQQLIDLRNYLMHRYYNIALLNRKEVYAVLTRDIPVLIGQLEGMLYYMQKGFKNDDMDEKLAGIYPTICMIELTSLMELINKDYKALEKTLLIESLQEQLNILLENTKFLYSSQAKTIRVYAMDHLAEVIGQAIRDLPDHSKTTLHLYNPNDTALAVAIVNIIGQRGKSAHQRGLYDLGVDQSYIKAAHEFSLQAYMLYKPIGNLLDQIPFQLNRSHYQFDQNESYVIYTQEAEATYDIYVQTSAVAIESFMQQFSTLQLEAKSTEELKSLLNTWDELKQEELDQKISFLDQKYTRAEFIDLVAINEQWCSDAQLLSPYALIQKLHQAKASIEQQLVIINDFDISSAVENAHEAKEMCSKNEAKWPTGEVKGKEGATFVASPIGHKRKAEQALEQEESKEEEEAEQENTLSRNTKSI